MAIYTDINQTNPQDKPLLRDIEAVFQSIENILSTFKGERYFNPDFGIDLDLFLFDLMDDLTELEMLRSLVESVQKYETRVVVDTASTVVTAIPQDNQFNIDLVFEIIGFDGQKFIFQDSITNEQVQGTVA